MLFKAISAYAIHSDATVNVDTLTEAVAARPFVPCGPMDTESVGWVSPYGDDRMVAKQGAHMMVTLQIEKKTVPASQVKHELAVRVAKIEDEEGRKVGRKQKAELKEAIINEMLPKVVPKQSKLNAWFDLDNQRVVVNSASEKAAGLVFKVLALTLGSYPAAPLLGEARPGISAQSWLANGECAEGFTFGTNCELCAADNGATVKYAKHQLDTDDIKLHINTGKSVLSLGMCWDDILTFTLVDNEVALQLKGIGFVEKEMGEAEGEDKEARFEGQILLETNYLAQTLSQLLRVLR